MASDIDLLLMTVTAAASVVTALIAVHARNLLRAVAAYAAASAFLACLFFLLGSPMAGVLELTVGAGLVAVLFLVALTLSTGQEGAST